MSLIESAVPAGVDQGAPIRAVIRSAAAGETNRAPSLDWRQLNLAHRLDRVRTELLNEQARSAQLTAKASELEQRLRDVAAAAEDVVWVADPASRRFVFLSPSVRQVFGCSAEQAVSDPANLLQAIEPSRREQIAGFLFASDPEPEPPGPFLIHGDGRERWAECRMVEPSSGSRSLARVGAIRDVTSKVRNERLVQERAREYEAFLAVHRIALENPDRQTVLRQMCQAIVAIGWADACIMQVRRGSGGSILGSSGLTDEETDATLECCVPKGDSPESCTPPPLLRDRYPWGAKVAIRSGSLDKGSLILLVREGPLGDMEAERIRIVASVLAGVFHRADLTEEVEQERRNLVQLNRRLIENNERERREMARELHDEIGQHLTALQLRAGYLAQRFGEEIREEMESIRCALARTIGTVRMAADSLRPQILDDLGLVAAITNLGRQMRSVLQLDVSFEENLGARRLPHEVETAAYRICQEALNNVARHSGTQRAQVSLRARGGLLRLQVTDRGGGFSVTLQGEEASRSGVGLSGMRERAISAGGVCDIRSAPGAGARVLARLPLNGKAAILQERAEP